MFLKETFKKPAYRDVNTMLCLVLWCKKYVWFCFVRPRLRLQPPNF